MTSLEIQAFLTVQQTLSISRAAEQLYISQSSLSSRLQTLEQELGAPLFVRGRGRRELSLTAEGERFLPLARQHRDLEEKMRALGRPAQTRELLRISSLNSIGSYLLPPVYDRFTRLWPHFRLEIKDFSTAEAREALERDELDLAFSTLSGSTEQIAAIPFLAEPMAFLCAADSSYPDPVELGMLSPAHEVYSFWCADLQQWHRAAFGADAEPQVRLELMSQIRLFTARPDAWAVVPRSIADALADAPDLRRCRTAFSIPDRILFLLCRREARTSEPVTRFLDCLRTVLQEQETPGLLL